MSTAMRSSKARGTIEWQTPDAVAFESKAAIAAVAGRQRCEVANDNANPVRRRSDGSLDIGHYKMRGRELRSEAFARFVTWIGEELLGRARPKS
jgi:hypothetical protein